MLIQSQTLEGKVSNLKDSRTNLSDTIGSVFLPTAKDGIDVLISFTNEINDNIKTITDWSESTNSNVVLVANSINALRASSSAMPKGASFFSSAMNTMSMAAIGAMP